MQVDSPDKIRNLAIAGHSDTGKTTLVSSLLYASGVVNRMNRVEDGNTLTDFDAEEIERGISIGLASGPPAVEAAQAEPDRLPRIQHLLRRDPQRRPRRRRHPAVHQRRLRARGDQREDLGAWPRSGSCRCSST